MEDKTFELMEKMYNEMRQGFAEVNKKLDERADKKDIARLESELKNDIKTLYDGYKQTYEIATETRNDVKELTKKVEKQELEITVVKKAI